MPSQNHALSTVDATRPTADQTTARPRFFNRGERVTPGTKPVMRTIGGRNPLVPNAAELARLAMADTRTAQERVLDTVIDRLAVTLDDAPPALRIARDD